MPTLLPAMRILRFSKERWLLCNDAAYSDGNAIGDPTETALSDYIGVPVYEKIRSDYPRVSEIPFDSERKLMSTCHIVDGKRTMFTKGATDNLISRLVSICDNGTVRSITDNDKITSHLQTSIFQDRECVCLHSPINSPKMKRQTRRITISS